MKCPICRTDDHCKIIGEDSDLLYGPVLVWQTWECKTCGSTWDEWGESNDDPTLDKPITIVWDGKAHEVIWGDKADEIEAALAEQDNLHAKLTEARNKTIPMFKDDDG